MTSILSIEFSGYLTLGFRTLIELKEFLKDEFEELIVDCDICTEIVGLV